MISKGTPGQYKDIVYFNSTRNYTLALLNAFNNIPNYIESNENSPEKSFTTSISFGNYEKALNIEDHTENEITSLNFNFLPRLVLSFEGITKIAERQTQKYQKFSQLINVPDENKVIHEKMNFAYNSLAYDFNFKLLLQARGLNSATQITETMLAKFNPSLNLLIDEFPLLDTTETQISISDPDFEMIEEFQSTDVNIINVTFDVTVRGNIYSPIGLTGSMKSIGIYMNIWDKKKISDSKLASYYNFTLDGCDTNTMIERHFDGTGPGSMPGRTESVITGPIDELKKLRPDFNPEEIVTIFKNERFAIDGKISKISNAKSIISLCAKPGKPGVPVVPAAPGVPGMPVNPNLAGFKCVKGDKGDRGLKGDPSSVQGPQGPRGPQGKGLEGPRGTQGPRGKEGAKGSNGSRGINGQTGPRGLKGDTGADSKVAGPAGLRGATGSQGPKGDTGLEGPAGIQGQQGYRGPQGQKGDIGLTGSAGSQGFQGSQGPQGQKGKDGADSFVPGPIGSQGPQGIKGDQGTQGNQGPKGAKGNNGATGAKGVDGTPGAKGDQGIPGTAGANGVKGDDGARGPKGDNGKDGTGVSIKGQKANETIIKAITGSAAGDMWIASGTGHGWISDGATPTVWTDAGPIKGPKGDKGDDGAKGATGATGPVSTTPGPQGIPGTDGAKGADSTVAGPKGTDGTPGAKGDTGAPGQQGIQGIQGAVGAKGPKGNKGDDGQDGTDGTGITVKGSKDNVAAIKAITGSATGDMWIAKDTGHGWVSNGTATASWTDAGKIHGPKGDAGQDGSKGDAGPAGPAGPKGDTGQDGSKGDAGPVGPKGPKGDDGLTQSADDVKYQKKIIHEFANTFPGYDAVKTKFNQKRYWVQGVYIYEDVVYIYYSGTGKTGHSSSKYIVVYDFLTSNFLYGFNPNISDMGESLVVRRRANGKLIMYSRHHNTSIGEWDITTPPANQSTLNATKTTNIRIKGWVTYDKVRDKLIVQSVPYSKSQARNEFRIVDPDTYKIEDYFTLDKRYIGDLSDTGYLMSYKVQGICVHNDQYVLVHGTAYNEKKDSHHKNKIGGVTYLNDIGFYESGERYNPEKFKGVLTANNIPHETMEFEGICSYKNDVYTLMLTNFAESNLPGGLFLCKERTKGIDFKEAGTIFGGVDSNMLPDNAKPYTPDGVRNPFFPLDDAKKFNSFKVILDYMMGASLKEMTLYPWGPNGMLWDIDNKRVGTSVLVHIKTVNLHSFYINVTGKNWTKEYWINVDTNATSGWKQSTMSKKLLANGSVPVDKELPIKSTDDTKYMGLKFNRKDDSVKTYLYTKDGDPFRISNMDAAGTIISTVWFSEDGGVSSSNKVPKTAGSFTSKEYVDGKFNSIPPGGTAPVVDVITVEDISDLAGADKTKTVIVKNKNTAGIFVYDIAKKAINDTGIIISGWVRQYTGPANIKWFGAIGDGQESNAAINNTAITNALKYENTYIPEGKYILLKNLYLRNKIHIISGDGPGKSVLKFLDSKMQKTNLIYSKLGAVKEIIEIKNLTISADRGESGYYAENSQLCYLTTLSKDSRVTVHNVEFKNSNLMGLIIGGAKKASVTNCSFNNIRRDGCRITGSSHVTVIGNRMKNVNDDSIAIHNNGTNDDDQSTVISNNTIIDSQGIALLDRNNVTISNNVLKRCIVRGIALTDVKGYIEGGVNKYNISITNNVISDMLAGNVIADHPSHSNVAIVISGSFAIPEVAGTYPPGSNGVKFIDPTPFMNDNVKTTGNALIPSNIFISGNIVTRTLEYGVKYETYGYGKRLGRNGYINNLVTKEAITPTAGVFIPIGCNNSMILNNNISGVEHGIDIGNLITPAKGNIGTVVYGNNVVISGNMINDVTKYGISLQKTKTIVKNNIIKCDSLFLHSNRNLNGSWKTSGLPIGIKIKDGFALFSDNEISDTAKPLEVDANNIRGENNILYGEFTDENFSIHNKGVGQVKNENINFDVISVASDPRHKTLGNIISDNSKFRTAIPTKGFYRKGEIVTNSNDTSIQWICTVTGNPGTWGEDKKLPAIPSADGEYKLKLQGGSVTWIKI